MPMKKIIVLCFLFSAINCQEKAAEVSLHDTPQLANSKPVAKPKETFFVRFYKFIRVFMRLLNNDTLGQQVYSLKELVVAIVQTVSALINSNIITPNMNQEQINKALANLDDETVTELSDLVTKRARSCSHIANDQHRKPDETTQVVLANFANIVNSFFNIVQDPENPDVVRPHLVGMLSGIVNIGVQVINEKNIKIDQETDDLDSELFNSFDAEYLKNISITIARAKQRCTATEA